MKVAYSRDAQQDLLEIHRWIHKGNPDRASSFIEEIEQVCESLAQTPHGFAIILDDGVNIVRRRVYKGYLVFYRVQETTIVILRVGHAAQDWSRIFNDDI